MAVIQPRFQIKLNNKVEEYDLQCEELHKDKLFLSQYPEDLDRVYVDLNGMQLSMSIDELKLAVDLLHQSKNLTLDEDAKDI